MKKLFSLMIAAVLCVPAIFAERTASDYSTYYNNLPVEVAKVEKIEFPATTFILTDFGAIGNGVKLNTEAIQTAIDSLSAIGGGHLRVPQGIWLTGPFELKSNVDLHLERNAIIYFSPDKSLYVDPSPKATRVRACISAERCTNIGITGEGIIDGNGAQWRPVKVGKFSNTELNNIKKIGGVMRKDNSLWYPWDVRAGYDNIAATPEKQEKMRNDIFRVNRCKNILLQGVTFQNSPKFHVHPFNSENVILDGLTVRCPWNAQNGDAIDISDCHRVLIVNCTVDCGDDGICMKSGTPKKNAVNGCEDILIAGNTVFHAHGGFVIGSESICGMKRIVVRDCSFAGTDIGLRFKSNVGRGGKCEDIYISGIMMTDIIDAAIHFECDYADRPAGADDNKAPEKVEFMPEFCDIHISDVVCENVPVGISANGVAGLRCVYDVTVDNSTFVYTEKPEKINRETAEITLRNVNYVLNHK